MINRLYIVFLCIIAETQRFSLAATKPRGAADAPNGYAPASVSCPATLPAIRAATGLSTQETTWLSQRDNNTVDALRAVLGRSNISNFDAPAYLDSLVANQTIPRVAIALSGGGYRAFMNGAGAIAAFDNRTVNSTSPGQLGGILQASAYLSGLSGGSWTVGSLYTQNFTSVESIIDSTNGFLGSLWQFEQTILQGPADLSTTAYYRQLVNTVNSKADAGYNVTITDYWGRSLSYQLVNATDGGPAYTLSSVAEDLLFAEARTPLPLIVAIERPPDMISIPQNCTIFEFNPWEMGSYDTALAAFAPLKYIGSKFAGGSLPSGQDCIAGFDNVGFIMGTSSSLFNQAYIQLQMANKSSILMNALNQTLEHIGQQNTDIADWPNPFYQYNPGTNVNANSTLLALVDGGEDLQNIPLHPLTLTARHVDVIFAVDSSADTSTYWPNGTAMVAAYQRAAAGFSVGHAPFPPVPDQNSFVNLGLNARPTFFGCYENSTSLGPLIVYLPNTPYSFASNVSTFDMEYSDQERDNIIQNGYNVATMGNGSVDPLWPACMSCAILARSFVRTRTALPTTCSDCFQRYCWNGTVNSTNPGVYEPKMIIQESGGGRRSVSAYALAIAGFYAIILVAS